MEWQALADRFAAGCVDIFGKDLTGVYLHGSLAMGCFNPQKSDIDLMVVTEDASSPRQRRALLDLSVLLNAEAPKKGLEMSVVRRADCETPVHPIPFDLHFSPAHLDWYRRDPEEYVQKMNGNDPDLAAHFTILRARGVCLVGAPVAEVFGPVPRQAYLDSILCDVESAAEDILENPVYIALNLCRVCAFAEDGLVLSKREGGEWGLQNLPEWAEFIGAALNSYNTDADWRPEDVQAQAFCRALKARIDTAISEEN